MMTGNAPKVNGLSCNIYRPTFADGTTTGLSDGYSHIDIPAYRDIPTGHPDSTDASRYASIATGARGHRVIVIQDPDDPRNIQEDGTKRKPGGLTIPYPHKTDSAFTAALAECQGLPYRHAPFCTYHRASCAWVTREDVNIADLLGNLLDVDWHSHPTAKTDFLNAKDVCRVILERADALGIPPPNHIVYTGRGLLIGYRYTPVHAYKRDPKTGAILGSTGITDWRILQNWLFTRLLDGLSDDRSTLCPGHFYKLPGTPNLKANLPARLAREPMEPYDFHVLLRSVWSRIREDYLSGKLDARTCDWPSSWRHARHEMQVSQMREPSSFRVARVMKLGAGAVARRERGERPYSEWVADVVWQPRARMFIRHLKQISSEGRASGDLRHALLFLTANAFSWIDPENWRQAYLDAIRPHVDLHDRELLRRVSTIVARVEAVRRGEAYSYAGEDCDPRYRYRNATIIARLGLTAVDFAVYRYLSPIAPDDAKQKVWSERRNERKRKKRVESGSESLKSIVEKSRTEMSAVLELSAKKISVRRIATKLGISRGKVERLIKGSRNVDDDVDMVDSEEQESAPVSHGLLIDEEKSRDRVDAIDTEIAARAGWLCVQGEDIQDIATQMGLPIPRVARLLLSLPESVRVHVDPWACL